MPSTSNPPKAGFSKLARERIASRSLRENQRITSRSLREKQRKTSRPVRPTVTPAGRTSGIVTPFLQGLLSSGELRGLEDPGVDETLLGQVPAVGRVGGGENTELGPKLGGVAGGHERADLLDEVLGVRLEMYGLPIREVAQVGVAAIVERDQVLELAEHAEGAASGLAGADRRARGLGRVASHAVTPCRGRLPGVPAPTLSGAGAGIQKAGRGRRS